VIAYFKRWTQRELDLRREAASASELAENMASEPGFKVPEIVWSHTARRVLTLEWIDGIKIGDRAALVAAGHDLPQLAANLVRAFLKQAMVDGFLPPPTFTRGICSRFPTAASPRSTSESWAASTAARGCGSRRSCTG
jgi:hypothetical protein